MYVNQYVSDHGQNQDPVAVSFINDDLYACKW